MPRPRDALDREVEARVINWALAVRGGLPANRRPHDKLTPDELDAEIVEAVMCKLKQRRPMYWEIVRQKWLHGVMDEIGAKAIRISGKPVKMSLTQYQNQARLALTYISGRLDESHKTTL